MYVAVSIATSTFSSGILACYIEYKSDRIHKQARSVLTKELLSQFTNLCGILYWLYDELCSSSSPLCKIKAEELKDKKSFRKILTECQKSHINEVVKIDDFYKLIPLFNNLTLDLAKKKFFDYFLTNYINIILNEILSNIDYLKDVFVKNSPDEYLKLSKAVECNVLKNLIWVLNQNNVAKISIHSPQIVFLLDNTLKSIGNYLKVKDIQVNQYLSLPEKTLF